MGGTRWRLFRLLGTPVYVDPSWLIVLALLTWSVAGSFPGLLRDFYPDEPSLPEYAYGVMGLVTSVAFFACILLHELGHALVARAEGMPGHGITLFLFGGVAEASDGAPSAGAEFRTAVAGPAVSVCLIGLFGTLFRVGLATGCPRPVVIVAGFLDVLNVAVLALNLIPVFPLDGGRVLRAFVWAVTGSPARSTRWAAPAGRFAWVLIGGGLLQLFLGEWLGGIWILLTGLFLHQAAQVADGQVLVRQALRGERVRLLMNPEPVVVAPSLDLLTWVNDYVLRCHRKAFPVVADGRLEGIVTTRSLAEVPREQWPERTVGEVMGRDVQAVSVGPDADAVEALGRMQQSGSSRLLVTEGDRLLGILSLKDLLRCLDLKIARDDEEDDFPRVGRVPHTWRRNRPAVHR